MKILVTGGAGFIGSHTCDLLLRAGHEVRILDCLDPQIHGEGAGFPAYLDKAVECVKGDVCQFDDCAAALEGIDAVYHFAAKTGVGQSMYDVASYVDTNVRGTAMLIEAIIKGGHSLKRLVLSSSRAVYGEGQGVCKEHGEFHPHLRKREDLNAGFFGIRCPVCGKEAEVMATHERCETEPLSAYAWTKKHQEDLCGWASTTFGIPTVILRYFNVFGSRQSLKNPYTGVVSIFYSLLRAGRPLSLYEGGRPIRDFVHVADVVRANLLALDRDDAVGSTFNVGAGARHSIADIANALGKAIDVEPELEDRGEFRVGDIFSCFADLSNSRSNLGYNPLFTLEEGMREFAAWASGEESVDLYDKTVAELSAHGLFGAARRDSR
jgi:dTDP-L-rhamnose 4-epimerase